MTAQHRPRNPYGPVPPRRPWSIRRTTTIDSSFPTGRGGPVLVNGVGRDLLTLEEPAVAQVCDSAGFAIRAQPDRTITAIALEPGSPEGAELVGLRPGHASRQALHSALGHREGTVIYQLLDDYAGASLVAQGIWLEWEDRRILIPEYSAMPPITDVCIGFAAGSTALTENGQPVFNTQYSPVAELENPADPAGWHALPPQAGPSARRARSIEVYRDEEQVAADFYFQDSAILADGSRAAVHEYVGRATFSEPDYRLATLSVEARMLPYRECPGAVANVGRMVGCPAAQLRAAVRDALNGPAGCTHLNDVLRALADVPSLAARLPGQRT